MPNPNESFYDAIEGALTPEQARQALALAESGDTGTTPDNGGAPTSTPANGATSTEGAGTKIEQQDTGATGTSSTSTPEVVDPSKAVILARDGKHTIPYEKLELARQGEQHWKAQAEAAKAQAEAAQQALSALQAQAQARADAGLAPTKTDNMAAQAQAAIEAGADADLFGDFSEAALKAGIEKLVAQQVAAQVAKVVQPFQAKQAEDAETAHYDAIYSAHPNADSIAQSKEFADWVDSHPSAVRNAYWQLFDPATGGTAAQIVEVFDAFKSASEKPSPTAVDPRAAARAATQAVRAEPPSSLSAIPGGRVEGQTAADAMAAMSGTELSRAMESMTPEQIEAYLNRKL